MPEAKILAAEQRQSVSQELNTADETIDAKKCNIYLARLYPNTALCNTLFTMKTSIYLSAVLAASAFLTPFAASALPFAQLNQTVLIHIPAKDVPSFRAFIGQTLNDGTEHVVAQWHSTARRSQPEVQVQITPGAKIQTQAAGQCRLLSGEVSQRSRTESWKVWFCQQADGSWKISGLG